MADERAYRIQISYRADSEDFRAMAPELDLEAIGESRAAATEALEELIDARMVAAAEGDALPEPFDVQEVGESIELTLAPQLLQDLNYYANRGKTDIESLATQLITYGLGRLAGKAEATKQQARQENENPERRDNRRQGGRRRGRRDGPRRDIDDQANFLEYVRDLEKGKGGGRRGR